MIRIGFEISCREVNNCPVAPDLIARLIGAITIIADNGYDSECIREQITKKGAQTVIPGNRNLLNSIARLMKWNIICLPNRVKTLQDHFWRPQLNATLNNHAFLTHEELQQFRRTRGRPQGSGRKEQVTPTN